MANALGAAGLKDGGCLTLFGGKYIPYLYCELSFARPLSGVCPHLIFSYLSFFGLPPFERRNLICPHAENAALPHGSGTDRALAKMDFALFDCTASLHGYFSDVTRVSIRLQALLLSVVCF